MNKKPVRVASILAIVLLCAASVFGQEEETSKPKKPLSKPMQELKTQLIEKRRQERAKAAAEAKAKAVDINRATKEELKKLPGMTDAYAAAIIAKRPYQTKADLVTKHALPLGIYQGMRKQVVVK